MANWTEEIREISKKEPTLRLLLRIENIIQESDPECIGMIEELKRRLGHG